MSTKKRKTRRSGLSNILLPVNTRVKTRPVWFAAPGSLGDDLAELTAEQRAWLHSTGWKPDAGSCALLPGTDGHVEGAVLGLGKTKSDANKSFAAGVLPRTLPHGAYHFASPVPDPTLAAIAWLMGTYRFTRYSKALKRSPRHLRLPDGADEATILRVANGVALGRDLINTPANDMGPAELEAAARNLADGHGAEITVVSGDDLLTNDLPLIHAVGRASDRAPRLIDVTWGDDTDPKITIVGKGICFDTGGLNIKPGNSMALMKKDMGGAASALALGTMVMSAALPVRLRILIPAADNNISANAFRPGDVLKSRRGLSVEIGNTDAEGRLVLADALTLADQEKPELLINYATLTGAARVALGPELPPFYTHDDRLAGEVAEYAARVADPVWRLPLWQPYDGNLASTIADVNHIADNSFAGSITAALFLNRFVKRSRRFIHFDIYGWMPKDLPGRPKGGEPQAARAMFEVLRSQYSGAS